MKVRQLFCDMFSDTAGDHNFVKLWFHLRESYDFTCVKVMISPAVKVMI